MSKGLDTWKLVRKHIDYISSLWLKEPKHIENVEGHPLEIIEKELKALEIIVSILDIKFIGDYLIARRGDIWISINIKYTQSAEIFNLLKEVLL